METAFAYLVKTLLEKVPLPKVPDALADLLPMLNQLALSEAVLTDDLRAKIQLAMLRTMRKLGLEGVDIE